MNRKTRYHLLRLARWMAEPSLWVRVVIGVAVFAIFLVGSVEYTSRPNFCTTCHYMQPFYDSWAESSHSEVSCTTCHFEPGLEGTIRGKLAGLEQVVSYLGRSYVRRKPWAEIDDSSCLRSGCHSTRTLEGEVTFKQVTFDHASHLGDLRRGKELRCTSCHSQVVQGEHILVTETTCFLCHMKESEEVEFTSNEKLGNCTTCHDWEAVSAEEMQEFRFDHTPVIEMDLECSKCHASTIVGDGFVPEQNCYNCHFEVDRLERYNDTELMHRTHISENKIECVQCHAPIQHKIERLTAESELECRTCHTGTHSEQLYLFTGQARGYDHQDFQGEPNPMLEAGLECSSCHLYHAELIGTAEVKRAAPRSCESCHGEGYDRLLELWQESAEAKLSKLTQELSRVERSVFSSRSEKVSQAAAKLEVARTAAHLVDVGKAVHNMQFADKLIGRSYENLNEALEIVGADFRLSEWDTTSVLPSECANCHVGAEVITTSFEGMTFSHRNHVVGRDISCQTCHSNVSRHGELAISKQQCNSCHHDEDRVDDLSNCQTCHEKQAAFYSGRYMDADLPDMMFEEDIFCEDCHWTGDRIEKPEPSVCVDCHDEDYADMPGEWRSEVQSLAVQLRSTLNALPEDARSGATYRRANQLLEDLDDGAARGVHNFELTVELLTEFRETLISQGE